MTPTEYERIHLDMSNTNNATALFVNLSAGEGVSFNGRSYTVDSVIDLNLHPNIVRYIQASFIVFGKRGAAYKVDVRRDGSAFAMDCTGKRSFEIDPATVSSDSEPACGDVDWDAIGGR